MIERSTRVSAFSELDRAKLYGGRSLALSRLNRYADALEMASLERTIHLRRLGADHPETLLSSLHSAVALSGLERLDAAVVAFEDLHERTRVRFGAAHYETVLIAHELGGVLMCSGRPVDAIEYFERAVTAKVAAQGEQSASTMNSTSWLALAYLRAGRMEDADRAFARVAAFESKSEADQRYEIAFRRNIGELRLAQDRAADALASCERGARLARDLLDPMHPLRVTVDACRGVALFDLGREQEGLQLLQSVREPLRAAGTQATVWTAKANAILDGATPIRKL